MKFNFTFPPAFSSALLEWEERGKVPSWEQATEVLVKAVADSLDEGETLQWFHVAIELTLAYLKRACREFPPGQSPDPCLTISPGVCRELHQGLSGILLWFTGEQARDLTPPEALEDLRVLLEILGEALGQEKSEWEVIKKNWKACKLTGQQPRGVAPSNIGNSND